MTSGGPKCHLRLPHPRRRQHRREFRKVADNTVLAAQGRPAAADAIDKRGKPRKAAAADLALAKPSDDLLGDAEHGLDGRLAEAEIALLERRGAGLAAKKAP